MKGKGLPWWLWVIIIPLALLTLVYEMPGVLERNLDFLESIRW